MRLIRLALANWRGVPSREITFSDGVTLIEGPNEIGKSTIVEALRTLFEERDSANKQSVKAIQPVGQDVGSRVEAEIAAGDYRFVYTKTYNKNKQTELRILAPNVEQLTGREAHERVDQILQETVDMGLWTTLLLEQGKEINGVNLANSDGLSRALDEAAGGSSGEQDDSALYVTVQTEYERYFTLRTGKPKFSGLEKELADSRVTVEEANAALFAIEKDKADFERCITETRRLEGVLPELQENKQNQQAAWEAISTIQKQIGVKQAEFDYAQQLLDAAIDAQTRRQGQASELAILGETLQEIGEQLAPLEDQAKALNVASAEADRELKSIKANRKTGRAFVELCRADEQYLQDLEKLAVEGKRLERLEEYTHGAAIERSKLSEININAKGLELLREAEHELQIAIGKRDTATSAIEITAEQDIELALNDESLELAEGSVERRNVAAELRIAIPGVAGIRIIPSQSASELEADVVEYEEALRGVLAKYGVDSLTDAIAAEASRIDAARDLSDWNTKLTELLGADSEADIKAAVLHLQSRCGTYKGERPDEPEMPESLEQATELTEAAEEAFRDYEEAAEAQHLECDRLREESGRAEADHRVAIQEIGGVEKERGRKQQQLDVARTAEPDEALDGRVAEKAKSAEDVQAEVEGLSAQLESAAPETIEALLENAKAVFERADKDLQDQMRNAAILEDRLTQAQADGRFEDLEAAEREFEELDSRYETTVTRAAAAARLWQVLNKHRDATRRAYVRPLKDGIEQLGKIVFGSDFGIELNEEWGIVSRTQNGMTIPFDALSVGAKEQLGVLTRLAAARVVSSQGGVPLILDDALGYSDPGRLETMGAAITAAGKDAQIILLTCTPGRFTHAGSAEVVRL